MNKPGWILVGVLALGLVYYVVSPYVFWRPPMDVRDCVVREVSADSVSFDADVKNRSKKVATTVYVFVWRSDNSFVEYRLRGEFEPDQWVHKQVVKNIGGDLLSLREHVSNISACRVHGIVYSDNSIWNGGSPS